MELATVILAVSLGGNMRILVSLFLVLFAIKANACPMFNAQFRCLQQGEEVIMQLKTLSQSPYQIQINSQVWVNDNQWHDYVEEGTVGQQMLSCNSNSPGLQLYFRGNFFNSKNEKFGAFNVVNTFTMKSQTELIWLQEGEYNFDFDPNPWPVYELNHCVAI